MKINNSSSSSGVGFLGLLTVAFIVLKLTHEISWEWKWVLAPIWIPFTIICSIALLVFAIGVPMIMLKARRKKKRIYGS